MEEDPNNIRMACEQCFKKKHIKTQSVLPALPELVGKYVMKRFSEGTKAEHMWVKIVSVNEEAGTLIGELSNEPTLFQDLTLGDEVVVYKDEIEGILEGEEGS